MNPAILPLPFDAARLRRLSERLMQSHHQNNYGGAVKRLLAIGPEELLQSGAATRIDVRHKGAFEAGKDIIDGAQWRDPERVEDWAREFAGKEVVVYCVYGHEVGQSTAARLRDAGIAARYLTGGIAAWRSAGRPTQPK